MTTRGHQDKLSLVVFGHSHLDPIKGAGGIVAKYSAAGHQTTIVPMLWFLYKSIIEPAHIVVPEAQFPDANTPEEINEVLKDQTRKAAAELGAAAEFLDYPPMRLSNIGDDEQAIIDIANLLRRLKADIVITHWPDDKHSGSYWHGSAGVAVSKAFFYAQRPILPSEYPVDKLRPKCLLYYMPNLLTPMHSYTPDVYIDISEFAEAKHKALTQFTHVGVPAPSFFNESRMVHARYWGQISGVNFAEVLKLPDARGNYRTALDFIPDEWMQKKTHEELSLPEDFGQNV